MIIKSKMWGCFKDNGDIALRKKVILYIFLLFDSNSEKILKPPGFTVISKGQPGVSANQLPH